MASLHERETMVSPYYLEAEINSPHVPPASRGNLQSRNEWFPTRAGSEFHGVDRSGHRDARRCKQLLENGNDQSLSGSFGVFFPGRLVAHFYDEHGTELRKPASRRRGSG